MRQVPVLIEIKINTETRLTHRGLRNHTFIISI